MFFFPAEFAELREGSMRPNASPWWQSLLHRSGWPEIQRRLNRLKMHRNVENNLRWSFLLGLFHVISMTSRVTNLELGAIRRFRLQRCDPCSISCWMDSDISLTFWKATEVRMVQYHSHLFVLLGMIFFSQQFQPTQKIPSYCVLWWLYCCFL